MYAGGGGDGCNKPASHVECKRTNTQPSFKHNCTPSTVIRRHFVLQQREEGLRAGSCAVTWYHSNGCTSAEMVCSSPGSPGAFSACMVAASRGQLDACSDINNINITNDPVVIPHPVNKTAAQASFLRCSLRGTLRGDSCRELFSCASSSGTSDRDPVSPATGGGAAALSTVAAYGAGTTLENEESRTAMPARQGGRRETGGCACTRRTSHTSSGASVLPARPVTSSCSRSCSWQTLFNQPYLFSQPYQGRISRANFWRWAEGWIIN